MRMQTPEEGLQSLTIGQKKGRSRESKLRYDAQKNKIGCQKTKGSHKKGEESIESPRTVPVTPKKGTKKRVHDDREKCKQH